MNLFSRIFGKKRVKKKQNEANVVYVASENDKMEWAMEKAKLTLNYFEKSLQNPQESQFYFSVKVKIEDQQHIEHIWLVEPSFDEEGNLYGIVANQPIDVTSVKKNQKIGIQRSLISDWLINENGRLIGGYTVRAIRDGLKEKDVMAFDKSVGLYIDEGVDYFEASFDTPEGAILAIEEAYNNNDLEKAIACKDFVQEAKLFLQSTEIDFMKDEELIEKTAEILRLSYIKSLEEEGMPNFDNIKRAFPHREKITENHYIITEVCWLPFGGKAVQKLHTYKTDLGWRVLHVVE